MLKELTAEKYCDRVFFKFNFIIKIQTVKFHEKHDLVIIILLTLHPVFISNLTHSAQKFRVRFDCSYLFVRISIKTI